MPLAKMFSFGLFVALLGAGCVVEEEPPPLGPGSFGGDDDVVTEVEDVEDLQEDDDFEGEECEPRQARGCKVWLDDDHENCFVGVQYCEPDGYWGPCVEDPTGAYASDVS